MRNQVRIHNWPESGPIRWEGGFNGNIHDLFPDLATEVIRAKYTALESEINQKCSDLGKTPEQLASEGWSIALYRDATMEFIPPKQA